MTVVFPLPSRDDAKGYTILNFQDSPIQNVRDAIGRTFVAKTSAEVRPVLGPAS